MAVRDLFHFTPIAELVRFSRCYIATDQPVSNKNDTSVLRWQFTSDAYIYTITICSFCKIAINRGVTDLSITWAGLSGNKEGTNGSFHELGPITDRKILLSTEWRQKQRWISFLNRVSLVLLYPKLQRQQYQKKHQHHGTMEHQVLNQFCPGTEEFPGS